MDERDQVPHLTNAHFAGRFAENHKATVDTGHRFLPVQRCTEYVLPRFAVQFLSVPDNLFRNVTQARPKHAVLRKAASVFLDSYLQRFFGTGGKVLDGGNAVLADIAVPEQERLFLHWLPPGGCIRDLFKVIFSLGDHFADNQVTVAA